VSKRRMGHVDTRRLPADRLSQRELEDPSGDGGAGVGRLLGGGYPPSTEPGVPASIHN
jgi:hypothetical protein